MFPDDINVSVKEEARDSQYFITSVISSIWMIKTSFRLVGLFGFMAYQPL